MTNEATGGASEIYSTTGCPAPHGTSGSSPPDSFHASDLNTLFGDGRVKFLNEEINIATVAALVSRNGASKEALVSQDFDSVPCPLARDPRLRRIELGIICESLG